MNHYSMSKQSTKTKTLVSVALLIALSVIGAQIKVQGSIAFDALPAFFAALYLGPLPGALIGLLGHLLTAITSGFPLTLPLHLIVALEMFLVVGLFGIVAKRVNSYLAIVLAILLNGPGATLLTAYVAQALGMEFAGMAMFTMLWIPLTVASAANVILAAVLYRGMGAVKGDRR